MASTMCPSIAVTAVKGVIEGWRLPKRLGTSPVTSYRVIAFSSIATWQSSMATSTICPSPVILRLLSAAKRPMVPNKAALMSPMEAPTLVGRPSGKPVMLMMPPMPCTTTS